MGLAEATVPPAGTAGSRTEQGEPRGGCRWAWGVVAPNSSGNGHGRPPELRDPGNLGPVQPPSSAPGTVRVRSGPPKGTDPSGSGTLESGFNPVL